MSASEEQESLAPESHSRWNATAALDVHARLLEQLARVGDVAAVVDEAELGAPFAVVRLTRLEKQLARLAGVGRDALAAGAIHLGEPGAARRHVLLALRGAGR